MFDHFKLLSLALVPLIRDAGLGNWDTESCQTLETLPAHTKCQCRQLATFAVLAQLPRDLVGDRTGTGTSLLGTWAMDGGRSPGCGAWLRWGSQGRMGMGRGCVACRHLNKVGWALGG